MSTYNMLAARTGIKVPAHIDGNTQVSAPDKYELINRAFLNEALRELSDDKARALIIALDEIEQNHELCAYSCALRDRAPIDLMTAACDEYELPVPDCISGFARDAYAFLFALSCVPVGRAELRRRGVPEKYDHDIPERMIRARLKRYEQTGDIRFTDYPWDMNFYCCAIVYLTRFYFIPCRCDYPNAYINRATGDVMALWHENARVRRDGQLDGVNGVYDARAFDVCFEESDKAYTGYVVHPEGRILNRKLMLLKAEWTRALAAGDITLAVHIPGGAGYTPENVRASMLEAVDYYRAYFPDVDFKGFSSESWLFDSALKPLLDPQSNIVRVMREFYNFPTLEGDRQAKIEVFGDAHADVNKLTPKTRLEKGMVAHWQNGGRFHTTGMFVLADDAENVGAAKYLKDFSTGGVGFDGKI